MKKIVIILLSFLLLFNSFGYVLVYFEVKQSLKDDAFEKMKDYISEEDLDIIVLSKQDFLHNTDRCTFLNDNEIQYKGKLYDIYRKYEEGENLILYCLNDEKENTVEKIFSSYIEDLNTKSSEQPAIRNILKTKISLGITPKQDSLFTNQIIEFIRFNKINLITNFKEILTPPPKESSAV
jgi:hypothetical protein